MVVLVKAAVTKYHKLGGYKQQKFIFTILDSGGSR